MKQHKPSTFVSTLLYTVFWKKAHFIHCFLLRNILKKGSLIIQSFLRNILEVYFIQCFLRYILEKGPFYPVIFKCWGIFWKSIYPLLFKLLRYILEKGPFYPSVFKAFSLWDEISPDGRALVTTARGVLGRVVWRPCTEVQWAGKILKCYNKQKDQQTI